jgi:ubiquinone/menaquinone biosynthesis C-methylase UbiE
VRVRVVDGVAEALPFDAASFDAAVASLALCTVPDLPRALREMRRALKPDGELRYRIQRVDSFDFGPSWMFTNPSLLGLARASASEGIGSSQP